MRQTLSHTQHIATHTVHSTQAHTYAHRHTYTQAHTHAYTHHVPHICTHTQGHMQTPHAQVPAIVCLQRDKFLFDTVTCVQDSHLEGPRASSVRWNVLRTEKHQQNKMAATQHPFQPSPLSHGRPWLQRASSPACPRARRLLQFSYYAR